MSGHPPKYPGPHPETFSPALAPWGTEGGCGCWVRAGGVGVKNPRGGGRRAEALRPSVCSIAPSRATSRTQMQRLHHSDRQHGDRRAPAPSVGPF